MAINKSDRARQFLPFDALKGLQEALREKERELEQEEKKELSEEQCEIISKLLNKLEIGTKIKLRYYKNKRYINYEGIVSKIDSVRKRIIFQDGVIIFIDDIFELEISN